MVRTRRGLVTTGRGLVTTRRGFRTSSEGWADGAHVEGRGTGGSPVEVAAEGAVQPLEPLEEVEEDGAKLAEENYVIDPLAGTGGAPVEVAAEGAVQPQELIEPLEEVEEDGAKLAEENYVIDPLADYYAGVAEECKGGEDVSDDPDEMTLSQLAAKKKKTKFHRLGYKKTRARPKRGRVNSDSDSSVSVAPPKKKRGRVNSDSDSSVSVAPPKKKGRKKTSKNRKSVETTALTVVKDPFKPISESRRADLSSLAKVRDFVGNMPILKTNLWQCIDLGKKLLHLPREEALELQQDAFRPIQRNMLDEDGKPHEFTKIEVVNLHGLQDIRTPITDIEKFPFYLQKVIRELGPINVKRYLYFGDQHSPWYCEADWNANLKKHHETAFLKLLFHYCDIEKGDIDLHSLFQVTNCTYNQLGNYRQGTASLNNETVLSDNFWLRKEIISFLVCSTNPPTNPPTKPNGISRKMSQEEFTRRCAIDYAGCWREIQEKSNAMGAYMSYLIRMVRANQGISTKKLKYDFEGPWAGLFKCNSDFQARVGGKNGCVVATWPFLQTYTNQAGKREERKKMLLPYFILLSFLYRNSKPNFTPLAREICDHAKGNTHYKDDFAALSTLGPRMLHVRKSDDQEIGPVEEPDDEPDSSDDEHGLISADENEEQDEEQEEEGEDENEEDEHEEHEEEGNDDDESG